MSDVSYTSLDDGQRKAIGRGSEYAARSMWRQTRVDSDTSHVIMATLAGPGKAGHTVLRTPSRARLGNGADRLKVRSKKCPMFQTQVSTTDTILSAAAVYTIGRGSEYAARSMCRQTG